MICQNLWWNGSISPKAILVLPENFLNFRFIGSSSSKSTVRAKLKAASQEERIHLWKEHFKNQLGKFPNFMDEPITKIISNQLDIKLEQFTQELDIALRKIKSRKAAGLDKIPTEIWKKKKEIRRHTAPILQRSI